MSLGKHSQGFACDALRSVGERRNPETGCWFAVAPCVRVYPSPLSGEAVPVNSECAMGNSGPDFWFLQVRVVGNRAHALKPGCSDKWGRSMPYGLLKSAGVRGNPLRGALQRRYMSHKLEGDVDCLIVVLIRPTLELAQ